MRELNSIVATGPVIIRIEDFGAKANSGEDTVVAMRQALEAAAKQNGPVVVTCAGGRYDFYPEHAAKVPYYITNTASEIENPDITKTLGIYLKGLSDVTLDGNGSLFIFHGKQTMITIDECERIGVRNVRFDYEWPTVVEMTVTRIGSEDMDVEVHSDSRYELDNGKLFFIGDGWRFHTGPMQEYDPVLDRTWRIDTIFDTAKRVEELEPGKLRIHLGKAPEQHVGHTLQFRDGIRDQVGAFINRSKDIDWRDMGMHFMHGLGVVCQFSENLTFDRINLRPRPETGRTVAAFADFIHVSGCRGKLTVHRSQFAGGHDDAINVHGTYLAVTDSPAPNQIRLKFMHHQTYGFAAFYPGDEIEFVRASSLISYSSNTVVSAEQLTPREILLTLAHPVPQGIEPGDVVENVTWTPEIEITRNDFSRIPTRGILITTRRKTVIRENRFERLFMSGVLVACDSESWFESGKTEDVLIEGNWFYECGNSEQAVINIAPENSEASADHPVHRRITIRDNRFEMLDVTVVSAKSTDKLKFIHNSITASGNQPDTILRDAFDLTACSRVKIGDNVFHSDKLNQTVRTHQMSLDNIELDSGQGLAIHAE